MEVVWGAVEGSFVFVECFFVLASGLEGHGVADSGVWVFLVDGYGSFSCFDGFGVSA